MNDPGWPPAFFSAPSTRCRQAFAPASEGREQVNSAGLFQTAHLDSRLSNSLAIPRDHWLQTRPHENLKGIPALQKHPEKCQQVLSLPGLPAAWVSALLGSPVQKLTSLGSCGTGVMTTAMLREGGSCKRLPQILYPALILLPTNLTHGLPLLLPVSSIASVGREQTSANSDKSGVCWKTLPITEKWARMGTERLRFLLGIFSVKY